jgi:hypothetical protein
MTTRITEANIQPGSITANSLDPNISIGGGGGGGSAYVVSVINANTAAESGFLYVLTDTLELTLPSSPTVGNIVGISNRSDKTDCVILRNGSKIMGSNEDLVINLINTAFNLIYVNNNEGWIII